MDSTNKPDSILKDVLPENASMQAQTGSNDWSHKTLEKLLFASINEQKTRRRWNIFFRLITLSFVALIFWQWLGPDRSAAPALNERHTAVVDIDGVIEAGDTNSAKVVIAGLRKAFADKTAAGVILRINSPGGSPVQANMINDEMLRLRKQHPEKPLYVVVEEMCASGGYYIAVAADKIYVNQASIVGSIGVLMDGFGFTGLMDKLGVERRLMTAGEHKGLLDPFSPASSADRIYAQQMLNAIHQQFIQAVKNGRGKRLKEDPNTFSGLFWIGEQAVQLGLADDFGTVDSVAKDVFKAEKLVDYTQREEPWQRTLRELGVQMGDGFLKSMKTFTQSVSLR